MSRTQKITPMLCFDDNAEEAVNYYVSIFKNSRIENMTRYGEAGPRPKGSVMTIGFELGGQAFTALNGGPLYKFSEALSLVVNCETQEEVDELWDMHSDGGQEGPCAWLKDKFGVSWQVVPTALIEMLRDEDEAKSARVMRAMMRMGKIDIGELKRAYEAETL
jgi:predicted 3-demethylubiquinone-9 3-methyltransferase (glyoxalase superfamily)